jgi:hypothetical protein
MGVGGQLHAPAALPQGKRPGTHFTGGWVGPRAGLDGWFKEYRVNFPQDYSGRGLKLISKLHSVPRLKMIETLLFKQ